MNAENEETICGCPSAINTVTQWGKQFSEDQNLKEPEPLPLEERYQAQKPIGHGGMGEIWQVYDKDLERQIALKKVIAKHSNKPDYIQKMVYEAQITGCLEHPNIIPIYDMRLDGNNHLFYTMRLIEGVSLKTIIEGLRTGESDICAEYSLPRLLRIFINIVQGLSLAHTKGILHRDLKPANIMLGKFGEVMIVDWGLAFNYRKVAKETKDQKSNNEMSGTLYYMSPEQMEGNLDQLGPASDIYSLGVILFEMISLRRPNRGSSPLEIMTNTLQGDLIPLTKLIPNVPLSLKLMVNKCLNGRKEKRYQDVRHLIEDIECFLDDLPLKNTRLPLTRRISNLYMSKHEYMKRFIPLDIEFFICFGICLGVFLCGLWPGLLKFSNISLVIAMILLSRPLYLVLSSRTPNYYPWFQKLQGQFPSKKKQKDITATFE